MIESQLRLAPQSSANQKMTEAKNESDQIMQTQSSDQKSTAKKQFLKRGDSKKYDPNVARQSSRGKTSSTKKYSYYADRFQKGKANTNDVSSVKKALFTDAVDDVKDDSKTPSQDESGK